MGIKYCAVVGCQNSTLKIDKWKKEICDIHSKSRDECQCTPQPFRLFTFPASKTKKEDREKWAKLIKRAGKNGNLWQPTDNDRVCSEHFFDGIPTVDNPHPTLNLGYELKTVQPRRKLFRPNVQQPSCSRSKSASFIPASPSSVSLDHSYAQPLEHCSCCKSKDKVISAMVKKLSKLTLQNRTLKSDYFTHITPFSYSRIKTDAKMKFYTGITSIAAFHAIFNLIHPYLPKARYWRGTKNHLKVCSKKVRSHYNHSLKKLSPKDEFLLTLMRLRLGSLNEDLADRFDISPSVCSNTFKTWVRIIRLVLSDGLIKWLPKETILEHMPQFFKENGYTRLRCIIDCTEIFLERPKSVNSQKSTWSSYKHHTTAKFLIAISPNGFVTFVSDVYGGKSSDKYIVQKSGFLSNLEFNDDVMTDKGFQIETELLFKYCNLAAPPGARLKLQFTHGEAMKTKTIANLRLHVERAIRRIKTFQILSKLNLPVTMFHHLNDIVRSCAALCNLQNVYV